jgi:hypothetical protein
LSKQKEFDGFDKLIESCIPVITMNIQEQYFGTVSSVLMLNEETGKFYRLNDEDTERYLKAIVEKYENKTSYLSGETLLDKWKGLGAKTNG